MSILLPGFITDAQVTSEIAVAETVIVGGVPNTYTYFSTIAFSLASLLLRLRTFTCASVRFRSTE